MRMTKSLNQWPISKKLQSELLVIKLRVDFTEEEVSENQ